MSTLFHQLLQSDYDLVKEELISRLLKTANMKKIYILGASFCHMHTENLFTLNRPPLQSLSGLFLLALIEKTHLTLNDIHDHIEHSCHDLLPVISIVITMSQWSEWLESGHPFACRVRKNSILIFGNDDQEMSPSLESQANEIEIEKQFHEATNRSQEFLAGADFFRLRNQNKMAAFMLHQSAEQCLRTLLKFITGFHCNTHSIDRLVKYLCMLLPDIYSIFPQRTEQEKRAFTLLQKAYIDTRYKEGYIIHHHDLIFLTERVNKLNIIFKDVYHNLKKIVSISSS
jgi:HEPN domain-containing protein